VRTVSIREKRWKLARYWDPAGNEPDQWELYDLRHDPLERVNLAHKGHKRTPRRRAGSGGCGPSSRACSGRDCGR
jgi:arylsulfatase A-like enzyme